MYLRMIALLMIVNLTVLQQAAGQKEIWLADKGTIAFTSEAPLEIIKAKSTHLRGGINITTNEFAFTMEIATFKGFNSEIQAIHFFENYLETKKYPQATFTGKLIEEIPFDTPGTYAVRAKGMLTIHGIAKERIIRGTLIVDETGGLLNTTFSVPVSDHGIAIPRIVQQKIADQIQVEVNVPFRKSSA